MAGNYEKQVLLARELFLKFDSEKIAAKFQLRNEKNYLYLPLLNRMVRISKTDGAAEIGTAASSDSREYELCLDYHIVMTAYDVLCCSSTVPSLSGQWCPLANLQVTMSSPREEMFTQTYADAFSGKAKQLQEACERIGGRRPEIRAGADACWEFDLFPFFPVQFRWWDKEEEFPPQIKLLWDKNALDFMRFETLYYVLHILLDEVQKQLKELPQ